MTRALIVQLVRQLHRNQTREEKILWEHLRNRRLDGLKFRRQHPVIYEDTGPGKVFFFVPDFYCAEKRSVVELDGKIHDFRKDYDEQRERVIRGLGLRVLRIKNEELTDIEEVKEAIRRFCFSS